MLGLPGHLRPVAMDQLRSRLRQRGLHRLCTDFPINRVCGPERQIEIALLLVADGWGKVNAERRKGSQAIRPRRALFSGAAEPAQLSTVSMVAASSRTASILLEIYITFVSSKAIFFSRGVIEA